jgi:hypothetical protein
MNDISTPDSRRKKLIRFVARVLTLGWVGFWGFFLVASLLSEPFQTTAFVPIAIYLLFFVIPVFIAWRWERIGGILFLLIGHVVFVVYPLVMSVPLVTVFFVYLTMAFPPLIAGLLFLIYSRKLIKMRA